MATFWLSTSGTDTNSGTNYANAQKTLIGLKSELGQGDIVNVVNDGNHAGTAIATWFNLAYSGTNFDTNPGIVLRGTDASGNKEMATIAFTAGGKRWANFDDDTNYWWVEGLRFDYSALRGTTETQMFPVEVDTQPSNCRINDCEVVLTAQVGPAVELGTNTELPRLIYFNGVAAANVADLEAYNNILINASIYVANPSACDLSFHHNIIVLDGNDLAATVGPIIASAGSALRPRRYYNNTIVFIQHDTFRVGQPLFNDTMDDTTHLSFHGNLLYAETGTNPSNPFANYLVDNTGSPAQTTDVVTCSNNYIAIGPNLETEAGGANDWDTSTATGVFGKSFNPTWRGGGTEDGTALNTNDVFDRTHTSTQIFNDYTASYTWTPGDYDHDLPFDLRPLVGRTTALGGGVVGAIDDAINADPVVIAHTYTGTSGVLKTTSGTDGVLEGSSDPDLDTLTATVVADVSHGVLTLNTTTGGFDYTPNITYVGTDTFTYKAWDGTTFSNVSTATLNISNQAPVGSPRSYSTPEGTVLVVSATNGLLAGATDADPGQTLSVTSVVAPATGTLVSYNITTGSFVYRPGAFASGFDNFTFKITDGGLLSAATTAAIYVVPVSDPVASDLIDTVPFFRPSLYVETEIRTRWKKNRKKALNEANYTDGREWNESTSRTIILTPAATTTVTLGGIAAAQYLILETDYPVEVSIDGTDKYWPVSKVLAVALTDFSSVALKSVSATNAQVILTVVD